MPSSRDVDQQGRGKVVIRPHLFDDHVGTRLFISARTVQ